MKYSVQQIEEALKAGNNVWFDHGKYSSKVYKATLEGVHVKVEWQQGQTFYSLDECKIKFNDCWICTKIEGEETMEKKTTPHKHAELIKLWADTGCQIQYNVHALAIWIDCVRNNPSWEPDIEYRVKPTLVKKWKWVFKDSFGDLKVTDNAYSEQDFNKQYHRLTLIQKIDSTMIEVEE